MYNILAVVDPIDNFTYISKKLKIQCMYNIRMLSHVLVGTSILQVHLTGVLPEKCINLVIRKEIMYIPTSNFFC